MQPSPSPQPGSRRVGVFGGSFDPVHLGHLLVAEQCREQAALAEVWFVPSARPPHKQGRHLSPFERRVEMLALAVAGQPAFRIQELEEDRPGPSYTADTLAELRQQHPEADLHLIVGADMLADLPHWHEPVRIVELAGLLVVARPGWPLSGPEQLHAALGLAPEQALRWQRVEMPLIEISSRDLRRRAAQGRSLRYLMPRAVECYIDTHHLYRPEH